MGHIHNWQHGRLATMPQLQQTFFDRLYDLIALRGFARAQSEPSSKEHNATLIHSRALKIRLSPLVKIQSARVVKIQSPPTGGDQHGIQRPQPIYKARKRSGEMFSIKRPLPQSPAVASHDPSSERQRYDPAY
jgi:hypothetical protein